MAALVVFSLAAQTQLGSDIDGEAAGDLSGYSVSPPPMAKPSLRGTK
jgi:hypothetical protein